MDFTFQFSTGHASVAPTKKGAAAWGEPQESIHWFDEIYR